MSGYNTNFPNINTDFDSIEAAVMETERGRNFLHEYARRNRHADTQVLLTALSRIEKSIEIRQEPSGVDQFRGDLLEMANAIAKTRKEISAVHSGKESSGSLFEASGELDLIVSETEKATSDILASAEQIQENAFTMREGGANPALCDLVDEHATSIYTACSFQDLTAQRTRKVIETLGFIEKRINAMVDIWAFAPKLDDDVQAHDTAGHTGMAKVMSQADVDFVLVEEGRPAQLEHKPEEPSVAAAPPMAPPMAALAPITALAPIAALAASTALSSPADNFEVYGVAKDSNLALSLPSAEMALVEPKPEAFDAFEEDELLFSREAVMAEMPVLAPAAIREPLRVISSPKDVSITLDKARSGFNLSAEEAEKALDALKSMSVEERTLLFS